MINDIDNHTPYHVYVGFMTCYCKLCMNSKLILAPGSYIWVFTPLRLYDYTYIKAKAILQYADVIPIGIVMKGLHIVMQLSHYIRDGLYSIIRTLRVSDIDHIVEGLIYGAITEWNMYSAPLWYYTRLLLWS